MKETVQKILKHVSLKILLVAVLFLASVFIFSFITGEVVYEHEDAFDKQVITFLSAYDTPGLIKVITFFTFFGSSQFLFPAYLVMVGYYFFRKNYRYAIDISVIALSSTFLMMGLKLIFHRPRPDLPIIKGITSYSFPSGHALSSFIFCSIWSYLVIKGKLHPVWKTIIIILLFLFGTTIGLSRIILNVHYTTDVIAGFCLGIVWVILSFWLLRKIKLIPINEPVAEENISS